MSDDNDFIDIDEGGSVDVDSGSAFDAVNDMSAVPPAASSTADLPVVPMEIDTAASFDTPAAKHDDDMDDETRVLIDQLLREEELYHEHLSMTENKTKKKTSAPKRTYKKQKQPEVISSAVLPSHNTRWTDEEDQRLRVALDSYGYGNWKPIAQHVSTRNPLQCKNRAHHWVTYNKVEIKSQPVASMPRDDKKVNDTPAEQQEPAGIKKEAMEAPATKKEARQPTIADTQDDEDDEEVSVEDSDAEPVPPDLDAPMIAADDASKEEKDAPMSYEVVAPTKTTRRARKKTGRSRVQSDDEEFARSTPPLIPKRPRVLLDDEENKANHDDISPIQGHASKASDQMTSATRDNALQPSLAEPIAPSDQSIPDDHAPQFDPLHVSEQERKANPEWFQNHYSKTPERYLKIRNSLLQSWSETRPKYLTKTNARKKLKNCGDVNAISRVHAYLETIGAINVDCINAAPRPPRRNSLSDEPDNDQFMMPVTSMHAAADLILGYDGPRKRKVRNEIGEWVDPKELEGRVIEHGVPKSAAKPKRIRRHHPHEYYGGDDFGRGNDPFRLVPVSHYNDDQKIAPFVVEIASHCLLVMDFHAHLAHTEIIGLLGGTFVDIAPSAATNTDENTPTKRLIVDTVFPCRSTSTGIQCEMDPESEMKAREVFAAKGLTVVGWYHSHPTFAPHPSIRDIENQTSYQTLFRMQQTGDEPFFGAIISPYDETAKSRYSQFEYFFISKEWNEDRSYRTPYACEQKTIEEHKLTPSVMEQLKELVMEYQNYEHKVDMLSKYGEHTRLDKLLTSMCNNLFVDQFHVDTFISQVADLIKTEFVDQRATEDANASAADAAQPLQDTDSVRNVVSPH
ncbi:hypothetical protein BC940DRAFT_22992 [Gongronella butleri]|nr:hypothetical protein BC940DRAFT_22992 [Gongronella butleri]